MPTLTCNPENSIFRLGFPGYSVNFIPTLCDCHLVIGNSQKSLYFHSLPTVKAERVKTFYGLLERYYFFNLPSLRLLPFVELALAFIKVAPFCRTGSMQGSQFA